MATRAKKSLWAAAVIAAATISPASHAIELTATWNGGGNGSSYSDPDNWDIKVVPLNGGPVIFDVVIPATGVSINFDKAGGGTINTLTLGNNSRIRPLAGNPLTVTGAALLSGIVDAAGGDFAATGAGTAFVGDRARAFAASGSSVTIGASAYSSKGLVFSPGCCAGVTYTTNLFTAKDAGTLLNLSSLQDIDAGFGAQSYAYNRQVISASGGATLNLSSVTTTTSPASYYDWLSFNIGGAGSHLYLDNLATVASAGSGRTQFNASGGASLSLPKLTSLSHADFALTDASAVTLGPLAAVANARFTASGASQLNGAAGAASYTSKGLVFSPGCCAGVTYTTNLFTATDAGTLLNLSSLQNIDAGFGAQSYAYNRQMISVSGGATLNLSGVTTTTSPASYYDWLSFNIAGAGSHLYLDNLATVASAGYGRTQFNASGGASLSLPKLTSLSHADFALTDASAVTLGPLAAVANARFTASGASQLNGAAGAASYTSKGLVFSPGCCAGVIYTTNLFTATDAGTLLNLSSLQNIDAGFGAQSYAYNRQMISVSGGATLNLSGVAAVTSPSSSNDWLRFTADTGGTINLASLNTVQSAGSGQLRFEASAGGQITTGGLTIKSPSTYFTTSGGSTIQVLGNLSATNSGAATIALNGAADKLRVDGSFDLAGNITLTAVTGATLEVGGNLSYAHKDETKMALGGAIVTLDGMAAAQSLEVGGLNVGTFTPLLSNQNFGFGQLVVGTANHASFVRLVDLIDNGNRVGSDEALYLFGTGAGTQGLHLLSGSTLYLEHLPAYALINGTITDLGTLIPAGSNRVAFDGGFIAQSVPEPSTWLLMAGGFGLLWFRKLRKAAQQA